MPVTVEFSLSDDMEARGTGEDVPVEAQFQAWAESACLDNEQDVVASIQVVSKNEIQRLNRQYRDQDKPTNVLSFPMELPDEVEMRLLGDLALCADVINEEAIMQGKDSLAHWAHMVIHGMLHLQGYDHVDDTEAEEMESIEIAILKKLGYTNPYSETK